MFKENDRVVCINSMDAYPSLEEGGVYTVTYCYVKSTNTEWVVIGDVGEYLAYRFKLADNTHTYDIEPEYRKDRFLEGSQTKPKDIDVLKDINPKDSVGIRKAPISTMSGVVLQEVGVAMLEGARKYGRHNYRVSGVRASVYYDAAFRHLIAWFEGQDTDPDSGINHVTKSIASLFVLRDAMINGKMVDDRPPKVNEDWVDNIQQHVNDVFDRHPNSEEAHTQCTVEINLNGKNSEGPSV